MYKLPEINNFYNIICPKDNSMFTLAKKKLFRYYFDILNLIEIRNEINYLRFIAINRYEKYEDKIASRLIYLDEDKEPNNLIDIKRIYESGDRRLLTKLIIIYIKFKYIS